MAIVVRKFSRLATYAFLLVLTAFVSAFFGSKKSAAENSPSISLIPPIAQAEVPVDGGGDAADGGGGGDGGDSSSGDSCT